MTTTERSYLSHWLALHPEAWHGWPTFRALEGVDALRRVERLRRHGCPWAGRRGVLDAVDELVHDLRKEQRSRYAGQVLNAF